MKCNPFKMNRHFGGTSPPEVWFHAYHIPLNPEDGGDMFLRNACYFLNALQGVIPQNASALVFSIGNVSAAGVCSRWVWVSQLKSLLCKCSRVFYWERFCCWSLQPLGLGLSVEEFNTQVLPCFLLGTFLLLEFAAAGFGSGG
jgi:hypothetical protein